MEYKQEQLVSYLDQKRKDGRKKISYIKDKHENQITESKTCITAGMSTI